MATLVIEVDQREVVAALRKLNDSIDKVAKNTERKFDKAGSSIGALTSPLGAVTAGVGALSVAFVTLAAVATKSFIDITQKGIDLNKGAELTKLSLTAIFEGNEQAADAFIGVVGDLAIKLGVSRQQLTGLGKGILPDVGGIQDTAELLENVIVLGRDAGQGIDSIRIATEEALSGNLVSLARRLNIPRKTLNNIKEYQKEMSLASAINKGLSERIAETGISADVTADSFTTLQGKIVGTAENFQKLLGESPFEELKEQARDFLVTLDEQDENIGFVAEAFGDLAANVIDFVGSGINEFIAALDFEAIERLVDAFNRALLAGQLVIDILFEVPDTQDGIQQITIALVKVQAALEKVAQLASKAKIALQGTSVIAKAFFQAQRGDIVGAITGGVTGLIDIASLENQEEAAKNTEAAFEKYAEGIKDVDEAQDKRRDTSDDATQADIDAGEAVLARKLALDELATAQAEAAKAQEEINKKTADAEEDRQKRLTSITRKEAQKRFDDEVKNAQKREDIARKNADSIEDIFRKQDQAIADASKDLSRDEQDIARKGSQERKQIERDAANERVEVERNFRQELQDIQRKFNQSAQDAERTNDAQAFLQAVRARDEQIEVAKLERDVSIKDVGRGAQEQRTDLKEQLAQEVEDSKIANSRKLEDLQARLNQELEQQAIKNERDLEQQAIQEQRQQEQRDLAAQRTLEDFERTQAEKETKLNESLGKQFALIEAAAQKELELLAQTEAEKTKIVTEEMARRARALREAEEQAAQTDAPALAAGINRGRGLTPMREGGAIAAGQTALVGEAGPEVFTAPQSGFIIPNQAMFSPPATPGMGTSNINNSRSLNVEQMGINPGNAVIARMVQNEMSKMLELLG